MHITVCTHEKIIISANIKGEGLETKSFSLVIIGRFEPLKRCFTTQRYLFDVSFGQTANSANT